MNIITRGTKFVQWLNSIARRRDIDQRKCPSCGSTYAHKHGVYTRHPWAGEGRQAWRIQRYRCVDCGRTFSEEHVDLIPGSWYARSVQRMAIDQWVHAGNSLRRAAEWVRSLIGKQERWQVWHVLSTPPDAARRCRLSPTTVHRWLDRAGARAEAQVEGQFAGLPLSVTRLMGADGLWARLRGRAKRVAAQRVVGR